MAKASASNLDRAGSSWVGSVLDGAGSWALRGKVPWFLGLIILFDSWDAVIVAYTLPSISAEWGLDALQKGWLISAGYGGQFLGAMAFGALAERFGRMRVFWPTMMTMSLLAIACAFAQDYPQLVALRLVQGMVIGAGLPIATCYVNEVAPTATRGHFYGTFQTLMASGFTLASLTSAWLIDIIGWRMLFVVGSLPLLAFPLIRLLPESPRWLAGRGRDEAAAAALRRLGSGPVPTAAERPIAREAERVPLGLLFAPSRRRRTVIVALLWLSTYLVNYGLLTWIPTIFVSMFGIPIATALRFNAIVAVVAVFLPVLLRQSVDRIGRRPPVIICTGLSGLALLALVFIPVEQRTLAIGAAIVGQIGISIGALTLWYYSAEIFETRIRSVALGAGSGIARAASMLTPLLVGLVIARTGSVTLVFLTFGISALVATGLWLFATEETAGRQIDD